MKDVVKGFLVLGLLAMLFYFAGTVSAADYYVRNGTGLSTSCGANWTNACDQLPTILERGSTYYIADGNYTSYTFNDAASGSQYITIKKATMAEHGTEEGWLDTYGDGQAIFELGSSQRMQFTTSFWDFDGQIKTGNSEGHGFVIRRNLSAYSSYDLVLIGDSWNIPPSNISIKYTEIGNYNSGENDTSIAVNIKQNVANIESNPNNTNYLFRHCYFHDAYNFIASTFGSNFTIEYSFFNNTIHHPSGENQCESIHAHSSDNYTVRHNIFKNNYGTGILVLKKTLVNGVHDGTYSDPGNQVIHDGWEVYGNIFYFDENVGGVLGDDGAIGDAGNDGYEVYDEYESNNMKVYNNVFYNLQGYSGVEFINPNNTGNYVYNNIWYNCSTGSVGADEEEFWGGQGANQVFGSATVHNYNWFDEMLAGGTDHYEDLLANNETNGILGTADPFVDWANENFTLISSITGTNFSWMNNIDLYGNIRGEDGNWDVGAYEYQEPPLQTEFYVSVEGDGDGCSEANPCNLTYAQQNVVPGSTVYLMNGNYSDVTFDSNSALGNSTDWIIYEALSFQQANFSSMVFTIGEVDAYLKFYGIWFDPGYTSSPKEVVTLDDSDYITFDSCYFEGAKVDDSNINLGELGPYCHKNDAIIRSLQTEDSDYITIVNSTFRYGHNSISPLGVSDNWLIENNTITEFCDNGIQFAAGSGNSTVRNNHIYNSTSYKGWFCWEGTQSGDWSSVNIGDKFNQSGGATGRLFYIGLASSSLGTCGTSGVDTVILLYPDNLSTVPTTTSQDSWRLESNISIYFQPSANGDDMHSDMISIEGTGQNILVERNILHDGTGHTQGIKIGRSGGISSNVTIRNNLVYDLNANVPMIYLEASNGNYFINNIFDTGSYLYSVRFANSDIQSVYFYNNIISGFLYSSGTITESNYNIFENSVVPAQVGEGANSQTGIDFDTLFVNRETNYSTAVGSVAIDNGTSIISFSEDIEGSPRPSGSAWDIGAYEYQSESIIPSISITYPENTTYYSNVTSINYTATNGEYCWYSTDNGAINSTHVATGTNFTGLNLGSSNLIVYCNSSDGTVNQSSVTYTVVNDGTDPTTSITANAGGNYGETIQWGAGNATISFSCSDDNLCDDTYYCVDTTNECDPWVVSLYLSPFNVSSDGISYVRYASNDSAGNIEDTNIYVVKKAENAPEPNWSRFQNSLTTNITEQGYTNITNLTIGMVNKSKIRFLEAVDLVDYDGSFNEIDLDTHVNCSDRLISLNSTALSMLNVSAELTFYNITFSEPQIQKDGVDFNDYNLSQSPNSSNNYTMTINVSGFSTYEVIEGANDDTGDNDDTSSESGSGGGGGSSTTPTYYLGENNLLSGFTVVLGNNFKASMPLLNETHLLTVNEVLNDSIRITVSSSPVTLTIAVGETGKIDVNSDGYYDLSIYLGKIQYNKASVTLKSINEYFPQLAIQSDISQDISKNTSNAQDTLTENIDYKIILWKPWLIFVAAMVAIVVLIILIVVIVRHSRK